ncbi:MAG: hypothetical protein HZA02_10150 [Nitrospinae bacterium]|nr:hypothetical protein [Nitrospinota bacterium]
MTTYLKRKGPCVCLAAFLPVFLLWAAPCFASAGVVVSVKGKVEIVSKGKTLAAKSGSVLELGDTIKSLDGSATVLYASGRIIAVGNRETFTVAADEGAAQPRQNLAARVLAAVKETAQKGSSPSVSGMVRGGSEIVLSHPRNSFVFSRELQFHWTGLAGSEEPEISIISGKPRFRYSFKAKPDAGPVLLPKDAPALEPGRKYYWKVEGWDPVHANVLSSSLAWFALLAPDAEQKVADEMAEIDRLREIDDGAKKFLKATLAYSYGLYHRSLEILRDSPEKDDGMKNLLRAVQTEME